MMEKWNDDWRNELKIKNEGCYIRLCECRNTKNDLVIMSRLMHKYNSDKTKEDCFVRMLEWVGDWNGQFKLVDLTKSEYETLLERI